MYTLGRIMYRLGSSRRGSETARSQCPQRYVNGIEVEDWYATRGFYMQYHRGILGCTGDAAGGIDRY